MLCSHSNNPHVADIFSTLHKYEYSWVYVCAFITVKRSISLWAWTVSVTTSINCNQNLEQGRKFWCFYKLLCCLFNMFNTAVSQTEGGLTWEFLSLFQQNYLQINTIKPKETMVDLDTLHQSHVNIQGTTLRWWNLTRNWVSPDYQIGLDLQLCYLRSEQILPDSGHLELGRNS